MQRSLITRWLFNSFWLSLLLHLLLLLLFSMVMIIKSPEKQKPPHDYVPTYTVPSYAYSSPSQPMMQPRHSEENKPVISHKIRMSQQKIFHTKKIPLEKPQEQKESVLASSLRILQENQFKNLHPIKNEDPIYLIGDMSKMADPLIKLLGKALSAHFDYPKMAGEFGIKGRVLMGMVLHPEGFLSDVQMLKSSNNEDLDAAALRAVNMAPHIMNIDRFLSKPRYFVVGFIFR